MEFTKIPTSTTDLRAKDLSSGTYFEYKDCAARVFLKLDWNTCIDLLEGSWKDCHDTRHDMRRVTIVEIINIDYKVSN